ncbi:hypothetical protein KP509_25G051000 [Ceratopteris richardii]|uniref:NPH3 domain-containing protein n=1 Tax=Ceratopteris richardii TaxID=49495 RepID=A0A8T2RRM0_CERRI|nr:hypothetical protein KP509_25G051000 [Ceratopteris richardii]KAH7298612.1 hypothetical protein KP509_25G051000 [Ceratopteris richardii]
MSMVHRGLPVLNFLIYQGCVAVYLEMAEEYAIENLIAYTECYLQANVFNSLKDCVQVLTSCKRLVGLEEVTIIERCIDAIASIVCCSDIKYRNVALHGRAKEALSESTSRSRNWWTDELRHLPINFLKQTIHALRTKGLQSSNIAEVLMHYAHEALKPYSLELAGNSIPKCKEKGEGISSREHEQRIVLEIVVDLLPTDHGIVPISFLCGLLRIGYALDTTIACHMELEKRIGAKLEHATVEDLLIPSSMSCTGEPLFDVDLVQRLVANFIQQDAINSLSSERKSAQQLDDFESPIRLGMIKVAQVFDSYLAEVAADHNLSPNKFVDLMELLPKDAREHDDGIYRAIDIYLKTHPMISMEEKLRICKCMDSQRLSQEACFHAAQNDRLPVQVRVQVLYVEQVRLHGALSTLSINDGLLQALHTAQKMSSTAAGRISSPSTCHASVQQENDALKMEVAQMKAHLDHLEKQQLCNAPGSRKKANSVKRLVRLVSRKVGRKKPTKNDNTTLQGTGSKNSKPSKTGSVGMGNSGSKKSHRKWVPHKRKGSVP